MDPINYAIDVQTPFQAALQGYQAGAAIRNDQQAQQQQEAARQQQQQQTKVIQDLLANKNATAEDYANATLLVPGMKDQFKQAWETRNTQQQQSDLGHISQVYGSLQSDNPDVAASLLDQRAQALRNSGNEADAKSAETMAGVVRAHPELARSMVGMKLSAIPGGDKVITSAASLGAERRADEEQPAKLKEAEAKAESAAVAAKFAESNAAQDLIKKGWDIKKIQADIDVAKQNVKIAAMNASIAREGNDLKRQELGLKLQDAIAARDDKLRGKVADVESARSNVDNMLNTIDRVMANPSLNDVLGSFEGRMPSATSMMDDEESDAIAMIDTLGSQAFLAQIPNIKGMGALSNEEGKKLQAALQNLDRAQSEEQFRSNLKEAQRLLIKGRKNISYRYGVPDNVPDTPAAAATTSPSEIDALIQKYGGSR